MLMLMDAVPDARVAVPNGVSGELGPRPPREKTTCPEGPANPAGTVAPTLAVRVTGCPNTGLAGEAVTLIVTAAFTVWL
jgi:hypothetical protein